MVERNPHQRCLQDEVAEAADAAAEADDEEEMLPPAEPQRPLLSKATPVA